MTSGCALIGPGTKLKSKDASSETERKFQCAQILKLSQAGEHKAAVDLADELIKNGCRCSENVSERIHFSRSQLNQADAYVLESLKHRKEGQLLDARTTLQKALELYPKYYWAQNLLKKVERSINAQLVGLKEEARNLEADGNWEGALSLVQDAIVLSPDDNYLKLEAKRLPDAMNMLRQKEVTAKRFSKEGAARLQSIQNQRQSIIIKGFVAAKEAEQKNELESAVGHTSYVLELSSTGDPLTSAIVKFARLLGLKLFSAGNFSKAQGLWRGALRLAPGNSKLQKYLEEVEKSLDNLKRIQITEPN